MNLQVKEAAINDFINRSFRDVADNDYIAARLTYRYGLSQQFLWFALQAIEKYLKAILLYNNKGTKKLGHNISKAYKRVLEISDIHFDFPKDIGVFIEYLSVQGKDRYFECPFYTLGDELLRLDKAIWYIRRYCQNLRTQMRTRTGKHINLLPIDIRRMQSQEVLQHPNTFKIFGGFLEKVLRKRSSALREHLVWKNFYYGIYRKKSIKRFVAHSASGNPTHFLHPEVFSELERRVDFSAPVREYFNKLGAKSQQAST